MHWSEYTLIMYCIFTHENTIIILDNDTCEKKPFAHTIMNTLDVCASSMSLTICDSMVSPPTWRASTISAPFWLMDPATTMSPGFLLTGMDSPVMRDSLTVEVPSSTSPSTGIFSPGTT